jgi:hypothetical protein
VSTQQEAQAAVEWAGQAYARGELSLQHYDRLRMALTQQQYGVVQDIMRTLAIVPAHVASGGAPSAPAEPPDLAALAAKCRQLELRNAALQDEVRRLRVENATLRRRVLPL